MNAVSQSGCANTTLGSHPFSAQHWQHTFAGMLVISRRGAGLQVFYFGFVCQLSGEGEDAVPRHPMTQCFPLIARCLVETEHFHALDK